MKECRIVVNRTARFYTLGEVTDNIQQVWFICHGYGQLASHFLKHFSKLNDGSRLIVAPEGMSRFYLSGTSGKTGASWMTSEDRLNEINDYISYLNAVYHEVLSTVNRGIIDIFLLGFSQGTATVARWYNQGKIEADNLILWGGHLPPEINLDSPIYKKIRLYLVYGTGDEYLKPAFYSMDETRLQAHGIQYQSISFEGGHWIKSEILLKLSAAETVNKI
ncbi:MAG: alpha/beta hydrolase [Ignavibacteriales bacterium]